jgi:hypothetical protein
MKPKVAEKLKLFIFLCFFYLTSEEPYEGEQTPVGIYLKRPTLFCCRLIRLHNSAITAFTSVYQNSTGTASLCKLTAERGGMEPQSRQSARLFLQSSALGLPHSLASRRVRSPLLWFRGGHGVGGGGSQFRRGDRDTVVL